MISEGKDAKMKETLGDFSNEAPWPLILFLSLNPAFC